MSNGLKGLTLAAGVIITCIVISIAFFVTREAKDIAARESIRWVNIPLKWVTEELSFTMV